MTTLVHQQAPPRSGSTVAARTLWRRWIVANAVGELVGLGLTGVVAAVAVATYEPDRATLAAGLVVASGALEGLVVGGAQWQVLRTWIAVPARSWVIATMLGAVAAWAVAVTPMQLLGAQDGGSEPSLPLQLALAAGMGLVAGPVLAGPQAVVLRRHVRRAWVWVIANSVAWAVALPVTFVGPAVLPAGTSPAAYGAAFAVGALAAGAVAGAVHGVALVELAGGRAAGLPGASRASMLRKGAGRLLPSLGGSKEA